MAAENEEEDRWEIQDMVLDDEAKAQFAKTGEARAMAERELHDAEDAYVKAKEKYFYLAEHAPAPEQPKQPAEHRKPSYDIEEEAKAWAEEYAAKELPLLCDDGKPEASLAIAYKAGAMATLEYAKNAMLQNADSFNRQCIVDTFKSAIKIGAIRPMSELPSFLKEQGLSDEQIKDILIGEE